jgi:hypothetical protein
MNYTVKRGTSMSKTVAKKAFRLFYKNKSYNFNKVSFAITREEQRLLIEAALKMHKKLSL